MAPGSPHDPLEQILSRALQRQVSSAEDCPDPELLAAFGDRELPASETERVEQHIAGCSRCLRIVTLAAESAPVPAHVGTAAGRLWGWWQWALPAAAVVLIAALWVATTARREVTEIAGVTQPAPELPGAGQAASPPAPREEAPPVTEEKTQAASAAAKAAEPVQGTRRRAPEAVAEQSAKASERSLARSGPQAVTGAVSGLPPVLPTFRGGGAVPGAVPGGVPGGVGGFSDASGLGGGSGTGAGPARSSADAAVQLDSLAQAKLGEVSAAAKRGNEGQIQVDGMRVADAQNAQEVTFTLSGAQAEAVTVRGQTATVDVQNARQRQVITGEELRDLPTARDLASLSALEPGVAGGQDAAAAGAAARPRAEAEGAAAAAATLPTQTAVSGLPPQAAPPPQPAAPAPQAAAASQRQDAAPAQVAAAAPPPPPAAAGRAGGAPGGGAPGGARGGGGGGGRGAGGRGGGAAPVVLVRGANPDAVWRARGTIVEFSPNGGQTFSPVHTASQLITGGVVTEGGVVWMFARTGLVVRSSLSGWIESFAPPGSVIVSLQAASATSATITLVDGSTLVTSDGGTTWTKQDPGQKP